VVIRPHNKKGVIRPEKKQIYMKNFFTDVLESECSVLTEIYQTNNYGLFGKINGNRDIKDSHVKKIRESIKTRQVNEVPIIVVKNPNYEEDLIPFLIVDGQHRYRGIMEENLTLSFVIAESIPESEVLKTIELLNTASLDWDVTQFMNSKNTLKNKNYVRYKHQYDKFDFEHEIFFYLMKKNGLSITHKNFKEGLLVVDQIMYDEIEKVFSWLEKFIPVVDKYGKRYYLKGLIDLYYLVGINLNRLEEVIFKQNESKVSDSLLYSGSIRQSLNHLVLDLYNQKLRKNLIGITSLDRAGNKYKLEMN
jgi:hypothetical protein